EAARRDARDGDDARFAEAHDRPLSELLLDLAEDVRQRLLARVGLLGLLAAVGAVRGRHGFPPLVAPGGRSGRPALARAITNESRTMVRGPRALFKVPLPPAPPEP